MFNNTDSRKISHWEVFLKSTYRLLSEGAFLLLKSKLKNKFSIWSLLFFNSQKCAFTDKVFRTLRSATKDAVFGICHLLKKVDENFCFCACS